VRVGAVDLGTNSTRLLVADVEDGRLREVSRRLTITRLGEGVDETHRLDRDAIGRVRACLDAYVDELEQLGATRRLAIATSALRDATDGAEFLRRLASEYGLAARLLSGDEEAAMTFRGVAAERHVAAGTLIVDIGGGSTELVLSGPDGVSFSTSLQMGCVRLTERFLHTDPPTAEELEACAGYVRTLLPRLDADRTIGVAGTVTTIAALDLGLREYDPARIHGHVVARTRVERELPRLAALTTPERLAVPAMEPGRAPVIVAGVVILHEVLQAYGVEAIEASERDILDGAALTAADQPPAASRSNPSKSTG
jgi:exopolyphosphatase/guanosine-5'-triphosphate,3'-diphosphate pyrophosphatase